MSTELAGSIMNLESALQGWYQRQPAAGTASSDGSSFIHHDSTTATAGGGDELLFAEAGQYLSEFGKRSSDLGADIEIAARQLMVDILACDDRFKKFGDVEQLLTFMFAAGLKLTAVCSNLPKIPFLLIEDLFDALTIKEAEIMWGVVESLTDRITHPDLFAKGKFVVLRTCNALLRRLSKSINTAVRS
jgi:hypothetical protein